tara:strand:- start:55 stop:897 length:843 start_codon:yes stop_codon:yes gene_type:complete
MKTINSLSGGKTSSYIAVHYPADYDIFSLVRIEDNNCKFPDEKIRKEVEDRIQAPFIATAEDDMIIYTMLDLEQYIGRKITWVTGSSFDQTIKNAGGYLPNKIRRFCTSEMKTKPIAEWRYKNIKEDVEMRFGYRANETLRAKRMMEKLNSNGMTQVKIIVGRTKNGNQNKWKEIEYCKPSFPLIDSNIYKDKIEEYWNNKEVRFAYMNNCVGCWWRSPLLLSHINTKHPKKMEWFAKTEENSKGTFRSDVNYRDIMKWEKQVKLFDDDFNECDSGYCGL